MPTICAKCHLVRPEDATVPVWQCPGCGVAYDKASDAQRARASSAGPRRREMRVDSSGSGGLVWGKWVLVLVLCCAAYLGYRMAHERGRTDEGIGSIASRLSGSDSPAQVRELADSAQASDVFIYTADWCPNCREAKSWLAQHGFKYEQCDIDHGPGCKAQLANLGGDGIPYLIVKGHHMKDGFDSEEFVAAMRGK
ncbi:hypothetical protein GmRootV59_02330 [Variovorax sp. V59]|uniref:glutaredoxin family protein n=1 Tax=unclassified Variovorax TaxID=663243 RepID=UPI0034E8D96B